MHRSGTSLVASILADAGLDLGREQLAGDASNPHGFWEDLRLLDLGRRMVSAATEPGAAGHADWGWTQSERFDHWRFGRFADAARDLLGTRAATATGPWGWKDPRAALALDFWAAVAPDARFLLLYRFPWAVAESMQRLGAPIFLDNPSYAPRIWCFYQRAILDFVRRRPRRTLLVSVDALLASPTDGSRLLAEWSGLPLDGPAVLASRDPSLYRQVAPDDPLITLFAATHPEAAGLLRELDAEADLASASLWRSRPLAALAATADAAEPVVSVVIPCRDHGEMLVEALASVHRCVPEPRQVLIVDDGSTDPRTGEVLDTLAAAGYAVHRQPATGLAAARNLGFSLARAPHVVPLDADNRLLPGFVERALAMLAAEERVGVVYPDRVEFGLRTGVVEQSDFDLDRLLIGNYIDACAVIRRSAWGECRYDDSLPVQGLEDWELWLALTARGWAMRRAPGPGLEYRVRPHSMIRVLDEPGLADRDRRHVVGKHQQLYRQRISELGPGRPPDDRLALAEARRAEQQARESELVEELQHRESQLAELRGERETLAAARADGATRVEALRTELAASRAELKATGDQLALAAAHIAFMESTRSWRTRGWFLRFRLACERAAGAEWLRELSVTMLVAAAAVVLLRVAPLALLAAATVSVILPLCHRAWRTHSHHGLMHAAIVYSLSERGVPAEHPLFAGSRLRYHWGLHWLLAAAVRWLRLAPPASFAGLNVIAVACFLALVAATSRRVGMSVPQQAMAALLALLGVNVFSSGPLARLAARLGLPIDHRVQPWHKFTTVNGSQVGLATAALVLLLLLQLLDSPAISLAELLLLAGVIAVGGFLYAPTVPVLLAWVGGAAVLLAPRGPLPPLALAGTALMATLVLAPYLWTLVPRAAATLASRKERPSAAHHLGLVVSIAVPWVPLLVARHPTLAGVWEARPQAAAMLAVSALLPMLMFLLFRLPLGTEYLFLNVGMIPLGIILAVAMSDSRHHSVAVAAWLVPAILPVVANLAMETRWRAAEAAVGRAGELVHLDPREVRLFRWIASTEPNSVYIDDTLSIPAFGRRPLFVGLDRRSLAPGIHDGWEMNAACILEEVATVPADKLATRRRLAAALLAGTVTSSDLRLLAEETAGRPLYVVARDEALQARLAVLPQARLSFVCEAQWVYRLEGLDRDRTYPVGDRQV
jgi:hypothetical protein